jgi:hypothetical protein
MRKAHHYNLLVINITSKSILGTNAFDVAKAMIQAINVQK